MKIKNRSTQVVIIGAGPTGLTLACQFIRYGIDFIIIDDKPSTTSLSKAMVVHARSLEIFDQIGLAEKMIERGEKIKHINILVHGNKTGGFDLSDIGEGMSKFPFMLTLEQSKTEAILYEYIQSNEQEVYWNTSFLSQEETKDGVLIKVVDKNGDIYDIQAEYLVGCDGAHSPVRHSLNLSFEGTTYPKNFYVADLDINWKHSYKELSVCLGKNTFVLFFPMKDHHRFRIIGMVPENISVDKTLDIDHIIKRIQQDGKVLFDVKQIYWSSHYRVHTRMAKTFTNGKYFLAGDAGHIHTPAGGQGMNTGIQDAYNLAWKLAFKLQGHNIPKLLESYDQERIENSHHLLSTTDKIFSFMAGSHRFTSFIRMHVFPKVAHFVFSNTWINRKIFPLLSQIGIAYPNSPLNKEASGNRMPYFICKDGRCIHDHLKEQKYHMVSFGSIEYKKSIDIKKYSFPIKHVHFFVAPKKLFKKTNNFSVLVRPDGHIEEYL